jgi:hypothetical protein
MIDIDRGARSENAGINPVRLAQMFGVRCSLKQNYGRMF